jgi:site-specific DNA-cytosine methylase
MKVLVACEESQTVCKAFRAKGHEAYSCDILPCSGGHPEWHIQGDVLEQIQHEWDMMIAFPPCTYLTVSGLHWNKRIPERAEKTEESLRFVMALMAADIPRIVIENPVGVISTRIRKPNQIIQPYEFGEDASKKTCLWLKGLPLLEPTKYVEPRIVDGKKRWANQTDSGQNRLGPSPDRASIRSKTYHGIAEAMADQWG